MCGILGVLSTRASVSEFEQMLEKIEHRGPDDFGTFSDDRASLGHRRLSIQDLSVNGHQPMFNASGDYAIIFNGEIYNHWEIRENLLTKYKFKSTSDTETILYGYIEYGEQIFSMLNGIFSLCIYNTLTKDAIIARDMYGVKPLYYYSDSDQLAFASELKVFKSLKNFNSSLDYKALIDYLYYLWSPGARTPFNNVKKLLSGHYIKVNGNNPQQFETVKYYDLPYNGIYSQKNESELIDELDIILQNAVRRQLLSDVPVGFFLSGGVDSSGIVAIAKKVMAANSKLKCFTIDSGNTQDEGFSNDLYYAQLVAKYLDVDLEVISSKDNSLDDLDKMIYHLEEPQADIAPIHVYNICKRARELGYIVLLGGTAGDDIFSGYRRHQALKFDKILAIFPVILKSIFFKLTKSKIKNAKVRRLQKLLEDVGVDSANRMVGYYRWLRLDLIKSLFTGEARKYIASYNPNTTLLKAIENIPNEKSKLNKMLYLDSKFFLTDHNLNYTDKLSMAVGVEVRVPFLDKELVEFGTRIPPRLKMKGVNTKYILKKVMERYLPLEVIYRSKAGFGAPLRTWISNLNEIKFKSKSMNTIFEKQEVDLLLSKTKTGEIDGAYSILSLLCIDSWLYQFKDK